MSDVRPPPQEALLTPDEALLRSAFSGNTAGAVVALQSGANANAVDPATGLSALHIAVGTNNLPLCRTLVDDWQARFFPDGFGRWPTVVAAECRVSEAMSDYIVEAEAKAIGAP